MEEGKQNDLKKEMKNETEHKEILTEQNIEEKNEDKNATYEGITNKELNSGAKPDDLINKKLQEEYKIENNKVVIIEKKSEEKITIKNEFENESKPIETQIENQENKIFDKNSKKRNNTYKKIIEQIIKLTSLLKQKENKYIKQELNAILN